MIKHLCFTIFYCHVIKLVIEVDGSIHKLEEQKQYDIGRETELGTKGIKVIRFTNEEIGKDIESLVNKI